MENLLNSAKQPNFIILLLELFIDGETLEQLLLNNVLPDNFYIKLNQILTSKKLKLSMFESVLINKKMILNDKKIICLNNFLILKLLLILDQVLILKEADLEKFLNWLCPIALKKLSFLAKIDYVDLDLNLLNGYVTNTIQKSWFSNRIKVCPKKANLLETSYQLFKYIHVNGMEVEDIVMKVKKIKLKLTLDQKNILQKWNSHARLTYNISIFRLNTDIDYHSKLTLRNQIVSAENNVYTPWILETPKEIRARSVFEAYTRYKTCIKQVNNKTIKFFNLKFKDKKFQKENGWSIDIQKQSIKKYDNKTLIIYPKITNNSKFKLKESIKNIDIKHDCKIHFDGLDYYILIPYSDIKKNNLTRNNIISLDPGIRTFLTGVDLNSTIELGDKANEKIYPLLKNLDKYMSRKSRIKKSNKRTQMNKRIKRLRKRIKNLQQELHKKTASWLCNTYKNVIIPDFKSNQMSKKTNRKLTTKTVRQMSVLGHKMFIQRLKIKAIELNTNIIIQEESFTSKTCSCCSYVKDKKFTGKTFICEKCYLKIDRDINGSINIFKKLFSKPSLLNWVDRT